MISRLLRFKNTLLFGGAALGALIYRFAGILTLFLPAAIYAAFALGHLVAARSESGA